MLKIRLSDEETKLLKIIFGTLQKIDDKLMIKATPNEIRLSACSGSAFMSVTCPAETFKNYDVYTSHALHAIIPFNNLNFLKKAKPEESTLKLEGPDRVLRSIITLRCENGLVKTYCIPTIDDEFLDEGDFRPSCPIQIVTKPEKLLKPISLFHSSITRMALQVTVTEPQGIPRILIRSIPDRDKSKNVDALHAKVLMDPESRFIRYTSSSEHSMEILFSAKEVKAMLNLCALLSCEAVIEYSEPGSPFFMEANALFQGVTLRIRLVLATIGEPNEGPPGVGQAAYAQENVYERREREDDMEDDEAEDEERGSNVPNTPPEHMEDDRARIPGYISVSQSDFYWQAS